MKAMKRILTTLLILLGVLVSVFFAGRYGWRIGGFSACQSAGIRSVEVTEQAVSISGFYPGSFPQGFCGYYAQEKNGTLFVGFRFSTVFGFFNTGNFDISIPVKGEITEVIVKTKRNEHSIWSARTVTPEVRIVEENNDAG